MRVVVAVAMVAAACVPLGQVFIGGRWAWPVLAAVLLPMAIAQLSRRCGSGPWLALIASVAGWFVFAAIAFLPDSLGAGFLPTAQTPVALADLWARGVELARVQPAPVYPDLGMLLLAATGVWVVAYTVETMILRFDSPIQAVLVALILWMTPLVIRPADGHAWPLTVPLLASAAWLLLESGSRRVDSVEAQIPSSCRGSPRPRRLGWAVAAVAITIGVTVGQALPGAGESGWLGLRNTGGATATINPIVNIRARLVGQDTSPLLHVRSPRPTYLRLTALDVYDGRREEWTTGGIRSVPVARRLPPDEPIVAADEIDVAITVAGLSPGTVLIPAVYQPLEVSTRSSVTFRYDARMATLSLASGERLQPNDRYEIVAAIPRATAEALSEVDVPRYGSESALPAGIPAAVTELARQIVNDAGAQSVFEQALAIQRELRSWTYSLNPPPGHGASAMVTFVRNREGYCEQFAGTMAVMLRSLGIPARVAVGYTPGTSPTPGEYVITQQNAHAWVEVRFPGFGWVTFEPTPRSDGDVLVPTEANPVPGTTVKSLSLAAPFEERDPDGGRVSREPSGTVQAFPLATPAVDVSWVSGRPAMLIWLGVAAIAFVMAWRTSDGWRREHNLTPAERALRARARIQRLGRGLGVHPTLAETDREYMRRLAGTHPAGTRLASLAAAVDYAPYVTESDAQQAEDAAREIAEHLLRSRSAPRRAAIRIRSALRSGLFGA
ncbi:MAG: transglutaminaseTgpA domain-containing protein [Egibacteraceae bacterium]